MGIWDGIGYMAGATISAVSDIKNGREAIERYKTGKTAEQKLIIDYFTSGLAGCFSGGKIFSGMKMTDYEHKVFFCIDFELLRKKCQKTTGCTKFKEESNRTDWIG